MATYYSFKQSSARYNKMKAKFLSVFPSWLTSDPELEKFT